MDKAAPPAVDLVELLASLDDPRALDGRRHRRADILVIAFCPVLCGQEEFTAMARFGQEKEAWLRGFLELPGGVPSHDTFRAVLSALDAKPLARTLIDWTEGVRQKLGGEIVASDGKSARRSGSSARAALHLVNPWAVDNGLGLGQEQTSEKSLERAFYLCSIAPGVRLFARAVRGHWGVENSLLWRLDVLFQEDQCRARTRFAAANLAALRQLALNAARADRRGRCRGILDLAVLVLGLKRRPERSENVIVLLIRRRFSSFSKLPWPRNSLAFIRCWPASMAASSC